MANVTDICAVCAWRADCNKKFSISGRDMHCPDFSRDMTIKPEPGGTEDGEGSGEAPAR